MALNLPESADEVVRRSKTDVQRELPTSNPFLRNSALSAIVTACANRVFDFYYQLREANVQLVWNTATDDALENAASIYGITRNPATEAGGFVVATGVNGSVIPIGSELKSSDGLAYLSTAEATILFAFANVDTLTSSGLVATVTTVSPHTLASGVIVTIANAVETEYNGDFEITVTGASEFTYALPSATTSPATGSPQWGATWVAVPIESVDLGADVNQLAGASLTLSTPIAGVNADMIVDYNELAGGTDIESDTDLRARFLDRVQNPVANFNVAAIVFVAKTVPGVTRVWVEEITPAVGQVTIYFTRDNDESIIPTSGEVTETKNAILTIKPAHTSDSDVIVSAPVAVAVNFNFTSLVPNTATMQESITANLTQFFREETVVGADLEEDAYRSVIFNTIDSTTGERVTSFELSVPSGDVTIATGELPELGTVVYQ